MAARIDRDPARTLTAFEVQRWARAFDSLDLDGNVLTAAKKSKLSPSSLYRFLRGEQNNAGLEAAAILGRTKVGGNLVGQVLNPQALKALEDFAYFRRRYFGRISTPWQERAAYEVLRAMQTRDREYMVINVAPGTGKSTLFTNDIICWLIARDRTVRILIGSRTERQARMYVGRIKKTLERDVPMRASADDLTDGIQFDAEATMLDDFGAFQPEGRSDKWRADALVVRQLDGVSLDDKEDTVAAFGKDSGFLGGRFDMVMWDDLVDRKNTKTSDSKDDIQEWWGTEAETRLEPGGVLVLQGQRIKHNDLYAHALSMKHLDGSPKYRHIIYQAHDEENCRGHERDVDSPPLPWPEGCLLDPRRLPMASLETIKHNSPRVFDVQYQQRDGDLVGGLIDPAWIAGGLDAEGYLSPGCLDRERGVGEVPKHLTSGRAWSFVTVDPSPTNWWGIIWWLYDPVTQNRYAIDLIRRKMNPEDFLSLDLDNGQYTGLCEDLRKTALLQGAPLQIIVFEVNAAQRWLLQSSAIQRWMDVTGISFVPHTTHLNKADPKYGLESIGDLFRQGKIRLPWGNPTSRMKVNFLVDEGVKYPDADTTDMIMSCWFGKLAVENHYSGNHGYQHERPSWLQQRTRGLVGLSRGLPGF